MSRQTVIHSGEGLMIGNIRRVAVLVMVAIALGCLGACSGGSTDVASRATSSPSMTTSPVTAPTSTEPVQPSWRTKYTEPQLAAYDDALTRFEDYESRSAPIWEAGKVTPAAEALFKDYFPSPAWQLVRDRLRTYEIAQVTMTGLPTVLDSRARTIGVTDDGGSVTIRQCVDYTSVQTTQYGKPVDRDAVFTRPVQRMILLKKSAGRDWLIYDAPRPTVENAKSCGGGGAS